jgi:hypothetical protein
MAALLPLPPGSTKKKSAWLVYPDTDCLFEAFRTAEVSASMLPVYQDGDLLPEATAS